jgi:hypothetical protein
MPDHNPEPREKVAYALLRAVSRLVSTPCLWLDRRFSSAQADRSKMWRLTADKRHVVSF